MPAYYVLKHAMPQRTAIVKTSEADMADMHYDSDCTSETMRAVLLLKLDDLAS